MRHLVRAIPTICAVLVAAASFALSYVALRDVAVREFAVPAHMAWLTPICVDGAVLAGSASLWASSHRGMRKDRVAVLTVVLLLLISVVINISHAGPSPLAKVIAALPPLTLLACLELVAGQYRRDADASEPATAAADISSDPEMDLPAQNAAASLEPTLRESTLPQPVGPGRAPLAPAPSAVVTAPVTAPAAAPAAAEREAAGASEGESEGEALPPLDAIEPEVARPAPAATAPAAAEQSDRSAMGGAPAVEDHTATSRVTARPRPRPVAGPKAPPAAATTPAAAAGPSITDQVTSLFQAHLDAGGDATDATLARTFAEQTGASAAHVRRVLGPLRMAAQTDTLD